VYLGTYSRFGVRVTGSHPPLVSADDFRVVQDRLNARRTSYQPRVTSRFLLSGIAHCGYCGNKLIGVSRKQSWKRRSGERVENSYRYYQCESRTNQSVCSYHTRRADALEREVQQALARESVAPDGAAARPASAVAAEAERDQQRLLARLRALDKRIGRYVEAATRGTLSKEKMRALSVKAAADRLTLEDAAEAAARRAQNGAGGGSAAATARKLADGWDKLSFGERYALLRDAVARIIVTDDAVALALR
jgi:hypothetical protein